VPLLQKESHRVADCWKKREDDKEASKKARNSGAAAGSARGCLANTNKQRNSYSGNSRNGHGRGVCSAINNISADEDAVDVNTISAGAACIDTTAVVVVDIKESDINVLSESLCDVSSEKQELLSGDQSVGKVNEDVIRQTIDSVAFSTSVPLMCRDVKILSIDGQEKATLRALFDGGATNSFIKLAYLPAKFCKQVKEALLSGVSSNSSVKVANICVKSATGVSNELCALASLRLTCGRWSGQHDFIITDCLKDKQMILGRDFMKTNGVVIDHRDDTITIRGSEPQGVPIAIDCEPCILVNSVTIEPKSEKLVECQFKSIEIAKKFFFEPKAIEEGVYGAYGLCKSDTKGKFYVIIQ
jgi:hypothetical protein